LKCALLAFTLALVGTGALFPQGAPAVDPSYASVEELETRMLGRLNDVRIRHGLTPLRVSAALSTAAQQHTRDMARHGFCGHESANGASFSRRVSRFYGRSSRWRRWSAGENVLCHKKRVTAARAVSTWLASPGHRANVLSSQWREVGVAAVYGYDASGEFGGQDVFLVTANFGVRR
jgi:uncharacterized protein YkwD